MGFQMVLHVLVCVCVCVCARARACVCARARARVLRASVCVFILSLLSNNGPVEQYV